MCAFAARWFRIYFGNTATAHVELLFSLHHSALWEVSCTSNLRSCSWIVSIPVVTGPTTLLGTEPALHGWIWSLGFSKVTKQNLVYFSCVTSLRKCFVNLKNPSPTLTWSAKQWVMSSWCSGDVLKDFFIAAVVNFSYVGDSSCQCKFPECSCVAWKGANMLICNGFRAVLLTHLEGGLCCQWWPHTISCLIYKSIASSS